MNFIYISRPHCANNRNGQQVEMVREITKSDFSTGGSIRMFEIQFADGYSCEAFADELIADDITESDLQKLECTKQDGEYLAYYFGNVCVRAVRVTYGTQIRLLPISGDRVACGEWYDLTYGEVCHYCMVIEKHLNQKIP